jgi:hypothetical protein
VINSTFRRFAHNGLNTNGILAVGWVDNGAFSRPGHGAAMKPPHQHHI